MYMFSVYTQFSKEHKTTGMGPYQRPPGDASVMSVELLIDQQNE